MTILAIYAGELALLGMTEIAVQFAMGSLEGE
jgi:hypothetical protein